MTNPMTPKPVTQPVTAPKTPTVTPTKMAGPVAPPIDVLQSKWFEMKGKVKTRWARLTDEDLNKINGKHEQLVSIIQTRYSYDRAKAEQEVRDFLVKP
jgi:uncharacterized protein YjbJ (UPF0337 family)